MKPLKPSWTRILAISVISNSGMVYDGNIHQSQVWILASDRLDGEPLCRLALPSVIPPGFHGTWQS